MSADQSLAVASNAMCIIGFSAPAPVNAGFISEQISLNPVVVRRAMGKLVAAGLARSIQGPSGGYVLALPPENITIQDIYDALSEKGVFERNYAVPQASCDEGRAIGVALSEVFGEAEKAFADALRQRTLADMLERAETT